jgi:hypothetical protein
MVQRGSLQILLGISEAALPVRSTVVVQVGRYDDLLRSIHLL